jgi:hypothetical protein
MKLNKTKLALVVILGASTSFFAACNNQGSGGSQSDGSQSETSESTEQANYENIVDEHIEAAGGLAALKKIKTIRKTSSVASKAATGNASGTTKEWYDLVADKGRITTDLGVYKESKGWVGQQGWRQNMLEPVRDTTAEELAVEKIGMAVSLIFTVKEAFGNAAFVTPSKATFNNRNCVLVKFVGSPVEVYLNGETKLIEGIVIPDFMSITYSDYRKIEGVQVAHKNKVDIIVMATKVTAQIEEIEFNIKLDAAEFSKPGSQKTVLDRDF